MHSEINERGKHASSSIHLHDLLETSKFFTGCKFDGPAVAKIIINHKVLGNYVSPLVANKFGTTIEPYPLLFG